jgi:hypothetical protein
MYVDLSVEMETTSPEPTWLIPNLPVAEALSELRRVLVAVTVNA